ncbi:aldo/keto reductase [Nonomuraea phyllanthi]|nr:aldo/keto reductase [Nonomuraea phyllanthi]
MMNTTTPAAAGGAFLLGGDRRVNRLGFGAMRLALGGSVRDPDAAVAVLRRAVELGVNHIDTAGFYGNGDLRSHELIRRALSPYPDDLVIATKVGPILEGGFLPTGEAGAGQLRGLVEEDLRRLGQDHLDLVYLRVSGTPGESLGERFAALAELRREGLIRHLGVSNVDAAQLAEARAVAPVAAVQNRLHLGGDGSGERGVPALCERAGIAFVPYFPLGGGRHSIETPRLAGVAARHGASTAQIALAWLLATSPVTLPIPGTSSLDHLEENVAAAALRLTDGDLAALA